MENRKEIKVKIDYALSWTGGIEIKQLREDLDAIEKLGATHVDIEYGESYGSAYLDISAFCTRIETDEELKIRIDKANKFNEELQRREIEQLNKLKLKYGQ